MVEIAQRLRSLPQFNGVRLCTLTGRDDDATKAQVMADFESGETPVMVATTVVEVGVDVPQASCITIFDADRYGLSQLHQLRGRVGRGGTDSWAFLVSRAEPGTVAQERLEVIAGSLDGAEIASRDLELRGAGDVLGDRAVGRKIEPQTAARRAGRAHDRRCARGRRSCSRTTPIWWGMCSSPALCSTSRAATSNT